MGRQPAAILLLGVITLGPAAAQAFAHDPHTVALHRATSGTPASRVSPLPVNLIVPDIFRPFVTAMWGRSPTFRRQCARLAEHPDVIARLELDVAVKDGGAASRVKLHEGGLNVAMQIAMHRPALRAEFIAHELEHVLEQVDGTDLRRLAGQGVDGVRDRGGRYETARAQAVGRTVAREVMGP